MIHLGRVHSPRTLIWTRRLLVMTGKELRQLSRDLPLLLFLIYSFTLAVYITGTGIDTQLTNAALVVYDADHSPSSRDLVHRFRPPYFRLDGEVPDPRDGLRLLDQGEAMVVLDIPPRFEDTLTRGDRTAVQLQVDTTNAPQGLSAASYAARIVGEFGRDAAERRMARRMGVRPRLPMIQSAHRVWFNPAQDSHWFESISHLLRMITLFAILLPASALVREKERGTVEQLLVSPLTPFQILFSKVLGMTVVILASTAVCVFGIMQPVFGVPFRGSVATFFSLTALYVFTTAGLGLMAATLTRNQAQVGMLTLLVVAPMLLLSGITTPVEAMPFWVQYVMALSPLRYFIEITYGILLKGTGLELLWQPALAMGLLGGVMFSYGVWRFRRQFG